MRLAALAGAAAVCLLLAGCAPTVALTPAPHATSVGCASVVVAMPPAIAAAQRRSTDAQGTAAWGTPAAVTMTCGVRTPGASTLHCYPIGGVLWLSGDDESKDQRILTTFDRDPGVQLVIIGSSVSASDALQALSGPIHDGTRSNGRRCLSVPEATAAPTPTPTPTPSATP